MEKPSIRIFHSLARGGGTLVSRCIGCMNDTVLLSEIHPLGAPMIDPLEQAREWHNLLESSDSLSSQTGLQLDFPSAVRLIEARCHETNQRLVIRNWAHLDFMGVPFVDRPSFRMLLVQTLAPIFDIIQCALVRHPVDMWLSLDKLPLMHEGLSLETFLEGYLEFAAKSVHMGFIRYEDFTREPSGQMKAICRNLQIDFDRSFLQKWPDYDRITGDVDRRSRGSKLRQITPLPRSPVEAGLLQRFRQSDAYWRALEILDYSDVE